MRQRLDERGLRRTDLMNTILWFPRTLLYGIVLVWLVLTGTGCNTTHGFGKDLEKAGEKIQDGTK